MLAYECMQIDEDVAGFSCKLQGGPQVSLVLTYSDADLQQSSPAARYQRWRIIYRFFDNGGVFFQEVLPAKNKRRACSRAKGADGFTCHAWQTIEE